MNDKKLIPLLEQFNIPLSETIDSYNFIGLDFGDGEISAAYGYWNSLENRFITKGLSLAERGTLMKNCNAYYISSSVKRFVYDIKETDFTEGMRYYNFKRCPGTAEAKAKYILDNGKTDDLTYEEVMAEGFNIAVNTIFYCDSGMLDRNKPTIILVGCPSSIGWEKSKLEYSQLLHSRLSLPRSITQPVYIAIHKESNAALARELDPKWGEKRIKRHEVIVILDNGSSTFDITVVGTNGIPENGEDSYQFGGNLIDENLLYLMWKRLEEQYPGRTLAHEHGHKLGLRMAKETYYGIDGDLQSPSPYMATLNGEPDSKGRRPKLKFEIDDDVMEEALNEIPITMFHFAASTGAMIKKQKIICDSWLDGCRKIYQAFYDEMKQFFILPGADPDHPVVPHRIILSGGVSVMPEVRALVKEVFGIDPVVTDRPNYAVSEGLSYVLSSEVRKGQYLRELLSEIPGKLPNANSLKEAIISAGVEEDWDTIKVSLKKWSEEPSPRSLEDWYNHFYESEFNRNLGLPVQRGVDQWFKNGAVETKITKLLQEKFEKVFPEYVDEFHYTLPKIHFSALKGVLVTINCNHAFFFGQLTSNETPSEILSDNSFKMKRDKSWRLKAYQTVLAMEHKVRAGGSNSYTYTYIKHRPIIGSKQVTASTNIDYPGLDSMYRTRLTDTVIQGIRGEVLALLKEPLKEYVELITPYFNMTARQ